jgi:hypothetical protein
MIRGWDYCINLIEKENIIVNSKRYVTRTHILVLDTISMHMYKVLDLRTKVLTIENFQID